MLNIVRFGEAVLEKIFLAFLYILLCKSLSPWSGAKYDTRDLICTNMNLLAPRMFRSKAFWPVVHEKKIFEDLSKFSLYCPLLAPKMGQPHYLNKSESPSPKHVSYQV